jgi:hypothetical protein
MTKECQCFHRVCDDDGVGRNGSVVPYIFFVENIIYTIHHSIYISIVHLLNDLRSSNKINALPFYLVCFLGLLFIFWAWSATATVAAQRYSFLRIFFSCMSAWLEKEKRDYPRKILLWRKIDGMEWTTSFKAMPWIYINIHRIAYTSTFPLRFFFADIEVKNLRDSFWYHLCTFINFYYAHLRSAPSPRNGRQHCHHLRLLAFLLKLKYVSVSFSVNHHEMCNTWTRYWANATYF